MKSTLAPPTHEHPKIAKGNIIDHGLPGKCSHAKISQPKRQLIIALFIVGAVVVSSVQLLMLKPFDLPNDSTIPAHITAAPHDPIGIFDNSGFIPSNGVRSGTGTSSDPYIISDWEINATSNIGIYISWTDKYFVIRNVTINSTAQNNDGIWLETVSNAWIHNVSITNCDTGIWITAGCSQVKIDDSFISTNNDFGIQTQFNINSYINITSNRIQANEATGISLGGTQYFSIVSNNVSTDETSSGSRRAVTLVSCSDGLITGNNLTAIYGEALWSNTCQRVVVANNRISSQAANGLFLTVSTGFLIYHNNFMGTPVPNGMYTAQAYDDRGLENSWNATYPGGGNYWADYVGVDQHGGPNQDTGGPDGFGDTPYIIDAGSKDWAPLTFTEPVEPIPEFPMLLLPIMSLLALVFVTMGRSARKHA